MGKTTNWQKIAEKILSLDKKTRFVAIIDLKGNIIEGIMKEGKSSLESQKQQEHFCRQVSLRRGMRQEFDRSLGKVNYIHIERKNVTQIVVYIPLKTIFVTVEPELSMAKKLQIVNRIKRIITNLKKIS